MKVLAAAMAVLLLVAICSLAEADPGDSSTGAPFQQRDTIPTSCCLKYVSLPVPLRMIISAHWTSNTCPQPAVILVTSKGMLLCANPMASWVQRYLKHLEVQKN